MTTRYSSLLSKIQSGGLAILDSGVSTELERRGQKMHDEVWSARVGIDSFDVLVSTHQAYIDAGADVITVNSYASSRLVLDPAGLSSEVRSINMKNIDAAWLARERCGDDAVLIAGSISHALSFASEQEKTTATCIEAFDEMVSFFEEGEVDLILLEMMSIPTRMLPLFRSVSSSTLPVWCGLSAQRAAPTALITGYHDETIPLIDNIQDASNFKFDAIGIMHTSVDLISDAINLVKTHHSGALMAYPDSGYFKSPNWKFEGVITPNELKDFAVEWQEMGVSIIGGCCGLGPEHTEALVSLR